MEKTETLADLNKMACKINEKRQLLITWGNTTLSDKLCIWHMLTLDVQNIIRFVPREKVQSKLAELGQDLSESMIYFRDNSKLNYSENYAAALDCFNRLYNLVRPYFLYVTNN